jgi:cell wall-associated NlpC family hydrolase
MLAFSLAPGVARAESTVHVILDGTPLAFDIPPYVDHGVTMVPIRATLTPLGASLTWDGESQTVTANLNGTEIRAVVGSRTATVNGQPFPLAMAVVNHEGRTLIPLRFFAEHLGFQVEWQGETRTVLLTSRAPTAAVTGKGAPESSRTETVSREATRRLGDQVVVMAAQNIGVKYAWGGVSPETGFDCSGFTYYLGKQVGVELPRTAQEQFTIGMAVNQADLAPGDLVFFTTYADGASHVGVYDGAGGFIHAQSPERGVVRTSMNSEWWAARYLGARRVFR